MIRQTRRSLFRKLAIATLLSVVVVLVHGLFVVTDPEDHLFYQNPIYLRAFARAFESTIYQIDRLVLGVDRKGSWFDGLQTDTAQFAVIFAFWWFFMVGAVLLVDAIRSRTTLDATN